MTVANPVIAAPGTQTDSDERLAPLYNLVLLDDDDHSYEYVILMLVSLFGFSVTQAFRCAQEVDSTGRAILMTAPLEVCELKRDQIHGFGPDPGIRRCKGAMSAIIEPAPGS